MKSSEVMDVWRPVMRGSGRIGSGQQLERRTGEGGVRMAADGERRPARDAEGAQGRRGLDLSSEHLVAGVGAARQRRASFLTHI